MRIANSHQRFEQRWSKSEGAGFFRLAYEGIYAEFSKFFTAEEQLKHRIIRVDSSMVAETCNKLRRGLSPGSKKDKTPEKVVKQVKYTVAFDGLTACDFKAFTDSPCSSRFMIAVIVLIFRDIDRSG